MNYLFKTNEASSISMFNMEGKLIQKLDVTLGTNYISLTDYGNSIYLIRLTNSKGILTKKIIVE